MNIQVSLAESDKRRQRPLDESKLGFGRYFSDHMFLVNYNQKAGWHNARIVPYGPLLLEPSAMVLHYAQEVFEGLKAYRGPKGEVFLFRARKNLERMMRSCEKVCIPLFPEDLVYEGIKKLIQIDKNWVPSAQGASLYIRPTAIATEGVLGARPSEEYLLFVITGPVGAYYPEGCAPVKIMIEDQYVRAVRGGLGDAKTSANYAASLRAQEKAHRRGFAQVLWLDAVERRYVEEVGTMNIFFKFKEELATPSLTGTILSGVTRDSVIVLGKDKGLAVNERLIAIEEIVEAARSGELEEVFGTGTAAVICPVSHLSFEGQDIVIGNGGAGPLSQELFGRLSDLQFGRAPDPYGWREIVA